MRYPALIFAVVVTACATDAIVTTTTMPTTTTVTTTTTVVSTTWTTLAPEPCPPAPYDVGSLPPAVEPVEASDTIDAPDEFTSIGGTSVRLWVDSQGATAIALVRGALPPQEFPAERGEVDVAGTRGVAGPYPDGRWVIAWFNEPADRCDQYTMVFYPPILPTDVEATVAAMTRLPG